MVKTRAHEPRGRDLRGKARVTRAKLVQRSLIRRQFDRLDTQPTIPLRLIPKTLLRSPLCVLLAEVDVDRFGIAGLD
jgi:hypothetical protein